MSLGDWKQIGNNLISSVIYAVIIGLITLIGALVSRNRIRSIHIEYEGLYAVIFSASALLCITSMITMALFILGSFIFGEKEKFDIQLLTRILFISVSILIFFIFMIIAIYG